MKENQEFVIDGYRFPVYRYQGHFERNLETNRIEMSMKLCIPTEGITPITPWIIFNKEKKDVTIVRYLSKDGEPFKKVYYEFIGARCTGHSEAYDNVREEVVQYFTAVFDERVITDSSQREKLTDLLDS